jgi:transposase
MDTQPPQMAIGKRNVVWFADRVKLIWWDGTGLCLLSKRLEGGQFRWPRIEDGVMRLTPAQLSALVEGLDWARVAPREVERPRAAQ